MSDPLFDLIHGGTAAPVQPLAAPRQMPADADPLMMLINGNSGAAAPAAAVKLAPAPKSLGDDIGHQLGLTARAGVTGLMGLPNMLGDAANSLINMGTSGVNKLAGTSIPQLGLPSQATQQMMDRAGVSQPQNAPERVVQAASSAVAGVNPSIALGKLLSRGVQAAPPVWNAADVARKVNPAPTAQALGAALQAAPGTQIIGSAGAGAGGSIATENGAGIVGQMVGSLLGGAAGFGAASGISAAGRSTPTRAQQLAQALRDEASNAVPDAVKPRIKLNIDGTTQELPVQAASTADSLVAPAPAPEGAALTSQRQLANIEAMRKVGVSEQRQAAISGDRHQSGVEYEESKLTTPRGAVMRAQLQKEQDALKGFSSQIVADTGASSSAAPEAAGQAIRAPLQGLSDHFDTEIGNVYTAAKEKAGGAGAVAPKNLSALMGDNDFRESLLSSPAGTTLLGSIERQVKRFQGIPVEGQTLPPAPASVNSAENLRKWLNAQWSPGNSRLIGQVKEAIDLDVANAGGKGVFDQARALHGQRRDTLDNPNGISKLLSEDGPKGINQAIPDEQVGPKLLAMPTGQFKHIIDTINALPPALQEHGQQAIAEIKAALARRIYAAGDSGGTQQGASNWNAANVTREMNAQRSKMAILFSPEELQKFNDLHTAGHVLQYPSAYKGAVAQGFNLLQSGAINAPIGLGAGAGGLLALIHPAAGAAGATLGSLLGAGASKAVRSGVEAQRAAALAEVLRNPAPSFPR